MTLISVTRSPIILKPLRERWYEVASDARILLRTDVGCYYLYVHKGFRYDSRSGGKLVDLVAHHIGTQAEAWAWLTHDIFFHDFGLSFETTNDLLRQQLRVDAGYGRIRSSLVHWGVSTEIGRRSFGNNSPEEEENKKLINFQWMDDNRGLMIAQAIDFSNNREKISNLAESSIEFRRRWSK